MKTRNQKFYQVGAQLKAEIDVYLTHEGHNVPSIEDCRHAVLQVKNKGNGYVVYDRLLCRIVNGVFYGSPESALEVAQAYNDDQDSPQDMAPNGDALGLQYPTPKKGE
jgi:hypothetical protein